MSTEKKDFSSIVAVIVIGIVAMTNAVTGGKEIIRTEIVNNTIDKSSEVSSDISSTDVSDVSKTEEGSGEVLGGRVHAIQEYFTEGLIIGRQDVGQSGVQQIFTDSSNNLYIGTSTDAVIKVTAGGGVTLTNVTFATSSLNYSGSMTVDTSTFHVDAVNNRVGIGTTTPSRLLTVGTTLTSQFLVNTSGGFITQSSSTLIGDVNIGGETHTKILVHGGASLATSTSGATGSLTAAQICDNSIINATVVGTTSMAFPTAASVHADCLTSIGDRKTILIKNTTTSEIYPPSTTLTITAGAGFDFRGVSTTANIIPALASTEIQLIRISSGTTTAILFPIRDAD